MKDLIKKLIEKRMPRFWQYLVKCSRRCPKCKSKHLDDGYWIRGWNNLCEQACGDTGTRCFDCGHIEWEQTCEEYKAKLSKWCRAYCT